MSERRLYETTIIVNAALEDNDIEAIVTKVMNQITNNGGNVQEVNKWGRRRLAYPINKKHNGYYVHAVYQSSPEFIPQLERFLTLDDTILRHLTLKLPQELVDLRAKRVLEEGQTTFIPEVFDGKPSKNDNKRSSSYTKTEEVVEEKIEEKADEAVVNEVVESVETKTEDNE
ncbi:MAG: 30S ribosomal protein S6 [Ignavibacteria bacterium GWF2_33_9]|nr:MAG: 30S ribosomal protein S6 [Ignavibacteria bacterium GWF2_33_9]